MTQNVLPQYCTIPYIKKKVVEKYYCTRNSKLRRIENIRYPIYRLTTWLRHPANKG